jgi:hypothetical protein
MSSFAVDALVQAPVWIVWLVGIVFAVVRWRRHSIVSLLTIVALVLLAASTVIGAPAGRLLFDLLRILRVRLPEALLVGFLRLGLALLRGLGWALLLVAVFGWRQE